MSGRIIRIGTRGSKLALVQARQINELLRRSNPDIVFELVTVKTGGDIDKSTALEKIGGVGVFTKRIEQELSEAKIDFAVHSAKDLPSTDSDGLSIVAVPPRESCQDVWLSRTGDKLADIESGSVVGTGAPRRRALLLNFRSDLEIRDIRGNVDTRLKKLADGQYDALVMAHAGLKRLSLEDRITEFLSTSLFPPAAGQGFLALQARVEDHETISLAAKIDDRQSHRCLDIERAVMRVLDVGCSAAVAVWARIENNMLLLNATVLDKLGQRRLDASGETDSSEPDTILIKEVTNHLISQGAKELITGYDE